MYVTVLCEGGGTWLQIVRKVLKYISQVNIGSKDCHAIIDPGKKRSDRITFGCNKLSRYNFSSIRVYFDEHIILE